MIASRILKCGANRVWLDPSRMADIEEAITAADVRRLINDGVIRAEQKKGVSSWRTKKAAAQKRKGRRKSRGSRKGPIGVRSSRKHQWMKRIRVIRSTLKELLQSGSLQKRKYTRLYKQAKGGFFRSRSHLLVTLEKEGIVTADAVRAYQQTLKQRKQERGQR